jgi:phosphate-selective porin
MKKQILLIAAFAAASFTTFAQEEEATPLEQVQQKVEVHDGAINKLSAIKISGYVQPQWQWGQADAGLKVGGGNVSENGNRSAFNRFGVRRGRIKFTYDDGGIATGVFQLNIVDKSNASGVSQAVVQLKEAYLNVKDPWNGTIQLQAGMFDRPFGNEISYSSSLLESPERSKIVQTLFPEEVDLGGKLILQAAKTSSWNFLKFEGGWFSGNAINPETNNRKDFIGHIVATKPIGSVAKWGLGASYYNGGVYQGTKDVYTMAGNGFVLNSDAANVGKYAKREYYGLDGQFSAESPLGMTQLRAEYIWGTQPGNLSSSSSPNAAANPTTETVIRNMNGWYGILVQDLGQSPFSLVVKYDSYDPNTKVKGNEIGAATTVAGSTKTNKSDIKYGTLGLGALWRINPALRLQVYYENVKNEKSTNLASANRSSDFSKDLLDDTFTVRLQFKF